MPKTTDPAGNRPTTVAPPPEQPNPDGGATSSAAPVPSEDLLRGRKAMEISHNGAVYRLQATRLGKLILTK